MLKLGLRDFGRVCLEDGSLRLDHLCHGPEGDAFPVRERTALAPEDDEIGVRVDRLRELPDEAALPDARDADERQELRRPFSPGTRKGVRKEIELGLAADERGATALLDVDAEAGTRSQRFPDRDRLGLPLRLDRLGLCVLDRPLGGPIRGLADEDPFRRGRSLQPGRGVDDVACDHSLALGRPGAERDDSLARVDGDADVEIQGRISLVQLLDRVADG